MVSRLVDRAPVVAPEDLIAGLVPPPLFAAVTLAGYRPDPVEPTQSAAVAAVRAFTAALDAPPAGRGLLRRRSAARPPRGLYLDGGFGVGKTHLLASVWHAAPAPKAYVTFMELTHLAGVLGFGPLVERLATMRLLAVDEFELDDPGDTVLVSTMLGRLDESGVALATTSNTPPDRLGERRFAAEDFAREIQGLAARFDVVRIDGPDFRHRGLPEPPAPLPDDVLRARAERTGGATLDDFADLGRHLATLHPSRYAALVDGVSAVHLSGVETVVDQGLALRLVVLADRLYDRQVPLLVSGGSLGDLVGMDLLAGGYRSKYRRAISRLVALNRLGARDGTA